jgi:hypothetical protein
LVMHRVKRANIVAHQLQAAARPALLLCTRRPVVLSPGGSPAAFEMMTTGHAMTASRIGGVEGIVEDGLTKRMFNCPDWERSHGVRWRSRSQCNLRGRNAAGIRPPESGGKAAGAIEEACFAVTGARLAGP